MFGFAHGIIGSLFKVRLQEAGHPVLAAAAVDTMGFVSRLTEPVFMGTQDKGKWPGSQAGCDWNLPEARRRLTDGGHHPFITFCSFHDR